MLSCQERETNSPSKVGEVVDLSSQNGEWIQEYSIVVNGSIQEVWDMYSSAKAMKTHVAPVMEVEFVNGGKWEASYQLGAHIGDSANFINEIVNIIPYKSITTKGVRAPYDVEALKSLRSTLLFDDLGNNRVKVSAITTGWMQVVDANYRKKVFDISGPANAEILNCLYQRMENGPLDWNKILNKGM